MLLVPCIALFINWHWQPNASQTSLYIIYILTESGSLPFALLTCAMFTGLLLLYLKLDLKKSALFVFSLFLCIGAGQAVKSAIKSMEQEPRPYVMWIDEQGYMPQEAFYSLPRNDRAAFIHAQDFSDHGVPDWLQQHWEKETGYSFPSGHTIFAVQWVLIFGLLLWRQKIILTLIVLWGLVMEASRLLLGMHWPIDEIVSCFLAPVIVYLTSLGWSRWIFNTKHHASCP